MTDAHGAAEQTRSAASIAKQRRPLGVPERANYRTIATAEGSVGLWYWNRTNGLWLAAFEGQPNRAAGVGGVSRAWDAIKLAGQQAKAYYGAPSRTRGRMLRFSILERDGFMCLYCGQRAPDVVLEVDHVVPIADGGLDEPSNLITACRDCNKGKRDVGPRDRPTRYVALHELWDAVKAMFDEVDTRDMGEPASQVRDILRRLENT